MRALNSVCALVLIALALPFQAAVADEHGKNAEEKSRRCLSMAQIDRIQVLDDKSILFHMRGGKKYINNLPYRCSGLKHNAFIHETSLQSYCDLDTITVYDTSIGMRMGACPLGKFEPYVELDKPEGEEQ